MIAGGSRPNRALTASVTWGGAAGAVGVGTLTTGGAAEGGSLSGAVGNSGVGGPTFAAGGAAAGGAVGMSAGGRGGKSPEDCARTSNGAAAKAAAKLPATIAIASRRNPWPQKAAHVPMPVVKRPKLGDFKPQRWFVTVRMSC